MTRRHSLIVALAALLVASSGPVAAQGTDGDSLGTTRPVEVAQDEAPRRIAIEGLEAIPKSARHGAFAPDRLQHASFAFASGLAVGIATEEPLAAGGVSFGLGLSKELIDDPFDWGDLAADLLGAALAAVVTHALR